MMTQIPINTDKLLKFENASNIVSNSQTTPNIEIGKDEKESLCPNINAEVKTKENDSEGFLDCAEYCNQFTKDGQKVWQCSICLLSNFRYKCLLRFHVISVHLKRKGCSWCSKTFSDIQDVIKHCKNCKCKAGEFKKLNEYIKENSKSETGKNKIASASQKETAPKTSASSNNECIGRIKDAGKTSESDDYENVSPQIKEICIHSCSRCNQKFSTKIELRQHRLFGRGCKHHQKKATEDIEDITKSYTIVADKTKKVKWLMYKCLKCGLLFPSQFVVKRHIRRRHLGVKQHKCSVCDKGFYDMTTWKYHTNSLLDCRNNDVAIQIAVRKDEIIEDEEKRNSEEENDNDRLFKCRVCSGMIVGKENYVAHLKLEMKESQVSKVSCPSCKKMFTTKKCLAYHKNLVHCSEQQQMALSKVDTKRPSLKAGFPKHKAHAKKRVVFRCPICEIVFPNFLGKSNHMSSSHPDTSSIVCNKCNRQYTSIVNLLYHKRVYHVDRNKVYQCAHCSFKTWNKYRLKQHSYRHTQMRDEMYKCETCSLVYDSAASLGRHKLIHSNIKNHVCDQCGKRFTQKCTLDRHLDSHKNIKRYMCAVCGQRYTQSYPLSKHVKSFHPDKFDIFLKERQTEKWKNDMPDSVPKLAKPTTTTTTPKRECVTIIQVPAQNNTIEDNTSTPKYKYILMNSAGKIIRPENERIMDGLLDTDVNNIRKSRILVRNAKAKNDVLKKDKQKQISIFLPSPNESKLENPPSSSVDMGTPSVQATVFKMVPSADAMRRTDLADVSFGLDPDNRLAADPREAAATVTGVNDASNMLSLDTSSVLGTENQDFYLPLEMQETFSNEVDQTLGLSFQNVSEDLWFDFTQTNFDASTLMGPSYSLLGLNSHEGDLQPNLDASFTDSVVNPSALSSCGDVNDTTNEGDNNLSTLQDIPPWTGDQMLLVQDGDKSYLISANSLAHLDPANNDAVTANLPPTSFDNQIPDKETCIFSHDQSAMKQKLDFVVPNSETKEVTVPQLKAGDNLKSLLTRK